MNINPEIVIKALKEYLATIDFSISEEVLRTFKEAEELCYKYDLCIFPEDYLLPLFNNSALFTNITNNNGGNSEIAKLVLESYYHNDPGRDGYQICKELFISSNKDNYRIVILDACIKKAQTKSRNIILCSDIIESLLDWHDEVNPSYNNGYWVDSSLKTPFNTIAHLVGFFDESLFVQFDDIRWELKTSEKKIYDLAISFAGEDREIARNIADKVKELGFKVFFDEYELGELWGKNLYSHLTEVYGNRANFCLMIISCHYAKKNWTNLERQAAQAKAFKENQEYILPLRIDDTEIPGLLPTVGYVDLREISIDNVIKILKAKIETRKP